MTEHKSQAQNKERAWALLRATLYEAEQAKQHAAVTSARKAMMGSGDRSQRIRTYNFPQNRCTDHRLGGEGGGEKNFNLDQIMAGQHRPADRRAAGTGQAAAAGGTVSLGRECRRLRRGILRGAIVVRLCFHLGRRYRGNPRAAASLLGRFF